MSPITAFLTSLEADLKRGNATEHTYRAAIERLFEQVLEGIEAVITLRSLGVFWHRSSKLILRI